MRHWLRNPLCYKEPSYNNVENFRAWVARVTQRFFDVTRVWADCHIEQCCTALSIEPPAPLPHMQSFSEDGEMIDDYKRRW